MNIRFYNKEDAKAWDDYVRNHPKGTFFHLSSWKDLIEKSFGHKSYYLIAEDENKIAGVFPLFAVKSFLFGKSLVSTPFATNGGILAENENTKDLLFKKAGALTQTENLEYLEIRNEEEKIKDLPEKDLYFVFKKEISADNDENLKAIPRKARRMVRVGIKNNLEARFGREELVDDFYKLFAFNYRQLGTPVFSKKYITDILKILQDDVNLLVIYKDGRPLSCVLNFYYKDQVIPYYSGAVLEARDYAANDYLYWALMSYAAEKGYRIFDFGRSKKDTGPFHFKRHWGFEPRQLHYQYYLNTLDEMPNISPANPKYQRKIELWKKLPLWATKIVGPHIVKYVP